MKLVLDFTAVPSALGGHAHAAVEVCPAKALRVQA